MPSSAGFGKSGSWPTSLRSASCTHAGARSVLLRTCGDIRRAAGACRSPGHMPSWMRRGRSGPSYAGLLWIAPAHRLVQPFGNPPSTQVGLTSIRDQDGDAPSAPGRAPGAPGCCARGTVKPWWILVHVAFRESNAPHHVSRRLFDHRRDHGPRPALARSRPGPRTSRPCRTLIWRARAHAAVQPEAFSGSAGRQRRRPKVRG